MEMTSPFGHELVADGVGQQTIISNSIFDRRIQHLVEIMNHRHYVVLINEEKRYKMQLPEQSFKLFFIYTTTTVKLTTHSSTNPPIFDAQLYRIDDANVYDLPIFVWEIPICPERTFDLLASNTSEVNFVSDIVCAILKYKLVYLLNSDKLETLDLLNKIKAEFKAHI